MFFHRHFVLTVGTAISAAIPGMLFSQINYGEAFQKSLYFYEAQASGYASVDNRVEWRGDSALNDGADVGRDLVGGWHDAGDGVVWTANNAFGASMLAWSLINDRDVYIATGQYQRGLDALRHGTDFLLKCIDPASPTGFRLYAGKGRGFSKNPDDPLTGGGRNRADHSGLFPVEVIDTVVGGYPQTIRPSYWVDSATGGADLAGHLAGAFAAASTAFRLAGDMVYADTLLTQARTVYNWGNTHRNSTATTRRLTDGVIKDLPDYPSRSATWVTRLIWAAAWLHRAEIAAATPGYSGAWADAAETLYNSNENANYRGKGWRTFTNYSPENGAYVLLAVHSGRAAFVSEANQFANFWAYDRAGGTSPTLTPGGFLARGDGGWNNHFLLDAGCALLEYSDSPHPSASLRNTLRALFTGQLAYIFGMNPYGKSYLQGFDAPTNGALGGGNADWFMNAHYRASMGSYGGFYVGAPLVNAWPTYGLLLPGPDTTDFYPTTAPAMDGNIKYKETIIYSGGLLSVLARKIRDDANPAANTPLATFPNWIPRPASTYQTDSFFVEAFASASSTGLTLNARLNNRALLPARAPGTLGYRYYLTLDGVPLSALSATVTGTNLLAGESVSVVGPVAVSSSVVYFEVRYHNAAIVPGEYNVYRRDSTLTITQSGGTFNAANDHSLAAPGAYALVPNIPVYDVSATPANLLGGFESSVGLIQWRRAHFNNVSEAAPSVTLIAERIGGKVGAVSAAWSTVNGTATSGADYVASSGTLAWGANEFGEKTVTIPLINDAADERRPYFLVALSAPTGGASLGPIASARVSVEDDDWGGPPDTGSVITADIVGNGVAIPEGSLAPSLSNHTDFGSAEVAYAPAAVVRTYKLRNLAQEPLDATSVTFTGSAAGDFTIVSPPTLPVPANSSTTFKVRFLPSVAGSRTATLRLAQASLPDGHYDFAIRGEGTPGVPQLAPLEPVFITASPGSSGQSTTTLENLGRATLSASVSIPIGRSGGYTFADSASGGPAFDWIDLRTGGTTILVNGDESIVTGLPIGFAFPFYGNTHTTLNVCANGYLSFNGNTVINTTYGESLPAIFAGTPAPIIAPYLFDLADDGTSVITYKQVDADTFGVLYENVKAAFFAGRITFQVLLKRDGRIIFQYKANSITFRGELIAFQDATRTQGLTIANAEGFPGNGSNINRAFTVSPPQTWLTSVSPSSASLLPDGGTSSLTMTYSTVGLTAGQTYITDLLITTNDPTAPVFYLPVHLYVGASALPNAPAQLSGAAPASDEVVLTWTDESTDETGFQLERSQTAGTGFALLASPAANATSYSDTDVVPNTTYYYRLRANNGFGSSRYTAEVSVTTPPFIPPPPPSSTWSGGSGLWSSTAIPGWNGGVVPNVQDATATTSAATGTITVNALYRLGTLHHAATSAINSGGSGTGLIFEVSSGAALLDLGTNQNSHSWSVNLTLNDPLVISQVQSTGSATLTLTGAVGGEAGISLSNPGTGGTLLLQLNAAGNSFAGGVILNDRTALRLAASGAAGSGPISRATTTGGGLAFVTANQTHANAIALGITSAYSVLFNVGVGLEVTLNGPISGTLVGNSRMNFGNDSSRMVLGGNNSWSGGFRFEKGGILQVNHVAALPDAVSLRGNANERAQLLFNVSGHFTETLTADGNSSSAATAYTARIGTSQTLDATVTLDSGTALIFQNATSGLELSAGHVSSRLVVNSLLNDGSASLPVTKLGPGVVVLARADGNTFDGGMTVSDGTLILQNTSGSATGTGEVTVAAGGTLGGTGSTAGSVSVASGGKLAFQIVSSSVSHNRFDIGGALTFAGENMLTITADANAAPGVYTLLRAGGGFTGPLPGLVLPADWTASLAFSGNDLILTVHATTAIESWRYSNFGTATNEGSAADAFDADGDGVSNLLEYALGTVPESVSSRPNLEPQISGDKLQMSFLRARADVTYEVLASSDLAIWNVIATNPGTVGEEVTVIDSGSIDPRRFLRLRVSVP